MPKRTDIKKIMLIGAGPIVIGQACEFDYSGVQACKALKEEGYELVLVNSNPATIMTDPEFADRTYLEPLTEPMLEEIIRRERPDALLPTLGGQTALNLAIALHDHGVLKRYQVEMIGARAEVIRKAEDRNLFKEAMLKIGMDVPRGHSAHSLAEALKIQEAMAGFPLVIRPGFTLGGSGGGIARDEAEFQTIVARGLAYSLNSEVLIEESVIGWKEFELEVMRDRKDNCVIVCSIENVDPMGIHTGDSVTVAPAQTLTDREYQRMRDATLAVIREIGVETGGANVQWAINPANGRMVIIEMNPRVSRSSALASKATGFPIARIAAKLAIGWTLDELRNDITRETPACFEPAIDYVVTKVPRFAFEKFPAADTTLGTQMKSVGETMSIGRTFKESFQKALRSLETGRAGFGADGKDGPHEDLSDAALHAELVRPNALRLFAIRAAFKRGWTVARIAELTQIDPWFLGHLEELAAFEDEIRSAGDLDGLKQNRGLFRQSKEFGYSDRQIAFLLSATETAVRQARESIGLTPVFNLVDTCAAEFKALTPYYYSTYGALDEYRPDERRKIMILGGGPNRIGQGIEFDYCCVHASFALREVVFNTGMTGYQEILSDPSYSGQLVTMTCPEIGNTGINAADMESAGLFANGFIMHAMNPPSNWRSETSLEECLRRNAIPAIAGIDTRALTSKLRDQGTLKGCLAVSGRIDEQQAVRRAVEWSGLDGQDYAAKVSCQQPYLWDETGKLSASWGIADSLPNADLKVVAYDFGIKWNILRSMRRNGMSVTVVPAKTTAAAVLALKPQGVLLSNGPADPAAVTYAIDSARQLLGKVPLMGICLGHQILGIACGGRTCRLKFGHHGCNHPVKDLKTAKVEITSQNHNFTVDPDSLDPAQVNITHINLNDQTVEGLEHKQAPMFSVQYHPEACPGPHDPFYLFSRFRRLMGDNL